MALSVNDKMRALLKNEAAVALIEEYWPGATKEKKLKLAANMPFKTVLTYFPEPPSDEVIAEFDARLGQIDA